MTGSIILLIGISLMRVGVNWAAGAPVPSIPSYGNPFNLGIAAFVLLVILLITRFVRGFFGNIAVLMGIVVGSLVCLFVFGTMNLDKVAKAPAFSLILPFQFGMPQFHLVHILTMCVVMIVVMIELAGMFLALGDITGRKIEKADMTRGLRTDGLGTLIGGIMNTFPYTSFSQNVGLVGVTGVRSRWVTVTGGAIMILMGLVPKLGALAELIPIYVLGGAGIVMFGMVAATGIRILSDVDYKHNKFNLYIVALSVGFGLIPAGGPGLLQEDPGLRARTGSHPALRHPADSLRGRGVEPVFQRNGFARRRGGRRKAHDAWFRIAGRSRFRKRNGLAARARKRLRRPPRRHCPGRIISWTPLHWNGEACCCAGSTSSQASHGFGSSFYFMHLDAALEADSGNPLRQRRRSLGSSWRRLLPGPQVPRRAG